MEVQRAESTMHDFSAAPAWLLSWVCFGHIWCVKSVACPGVHHSNHCKSLCEDLHQSFQSVFGCANEHTISFYDISMSRWNVLLIAPSPSPFLYPFTINQNYEEVVHFSLRHVEPVWVLTTWQAISILVTHDVYMLVWLVHTTVLHSSTLYNWDNLG